MATYQQIPGGEVLSALVQRVNEQQDAVRAHERGSTEPTIKPTGLLWWCTSAPILAAALGVPAGATEGLLMWDGAAWRFKLDAEHPPLMVSGENSPIANIPWGGFIIIGLGAGTASGHSVRYEQVVHRDGALAWTGNQNAGGNRITNLAAPVDASDAARKADIPDASGQIWFGGNRHGTHIVRYLDEEGGGVPDDYNTVCGFKPRHLRLRLEGRFWRQDNNATGSLAQTIVELDRHDADSTGGFAGTPTTATVIVVSGFEVTVTWLATGFRLEFRAAGGGAAQYLRNIVNAAVDGAIQVLALGDPTGG